MLEGVGQWFFLVSYLIYCSIIFIFYYKNKKATFWHKTNLFRVDNSHFSTNINVLSVILQSLQTDNRLTEI